MKHFKSYSLPVLALAALMTGCSSDDDLVQSPGGSFTDAPAITINLSEIETRGFSSEAGAWTNFKANASGVGDDYQARVSLMVYDVNNPVTPITVAVPKLIDWSPSLVDQVEFGHLRVPSGATYKAVAFVDFVRKADGKAFYDVENLSDVRMLLDATEDNGSAGSEMRDSYTGQVTFTLTGTGDDAQVVAGEVVAHPDGTGKPADLEADVTTVTGKSSETELNILARRRLAKVRIALTDYQTYGEWRQFFKGTSSTGLLNAVAMQVKDLSTRYNAVSQQPRTEDRQTTVLLSEYQYDGTAPTVNWIRPMKSDLSGPAALDAADMVGVSYTDADMASLGDDAAAYPVLGFNYFIPATLDDAAVYDMSFAALSRQGAGAYTWSDAVGTNGDWKTLNVRHINSVPVVTNALTTVWGSFLTASTPFFLVTVTDLYGGSSADFILSDDNTVSPILAPDGVFDIDTDVDADGVLTVPAGKHYKVISSTGNPTDHRIVVEAGATLTLAGVDITAIPDDTDHRFAAITCEGDATIILADGTENKVLSGYYQWPGIQAGPAGTTLTITGTTGKLDARSRRYSAAIGTGHSGTCGDIVISGGEIITVSGNEEGAGIGTGYAGTCGDIVISDGTITASGALRGAGIGSGLWGDCGDIVISGGTITASGKQGAGIGSGERGTCGDIIISGGFVTASGNNGAGIGSGCSGPLRIASCGNITISGGTVTASNVMFSAGIGSSEASDCGDILIKSTVTSVTATKGSDAPNSIGAGRNGTCGTVTIEDPSKVTEN